MSNETSIKSSNETIDYQGFNAFQGLVNIGLFNDIIDFAAGAADSPALTLTHLRATHLWYTQTNKENIQQKYGFRYFGELLERYEEKYGSDIADIRAIALAMAYAKDLLTDKMFVGRQKETFLRKITKLAKSDLYLKGALYQLNKDSTDVQDLLDDITHTTYTKTEELLFAVSLFDGFEQAFSLFKPQFISLLDTGRTIPIIGNTGIFLWLIKQFRKGDWLKGLRTKDIALFKAIAELPVSFVKEGNKHHTVLLNNGYTTEEILYLNSTAVRYRPTNDTMDLNSITAEKIAVEMCAVFINSETALPPDVFGHLEWLFKKYGKFAIKIGGYSGVFQAIKDRIKLANPQIFLWLYKQSRPVFSHHDPLLPYTLFGFDIMDEKWDVLAGGLEPADYLYLFDSRLADNCGTVSREHIEEQISKYEALTGTPYLAAFDGEHSYDRDTVFGALVKKGIINLISAFESRPIIKIKPEDDPNDGPNESTPAILEYIKQFIKGIESKEAFEFFRYFLTKHSFDDMLEIFKLRSNGYRDYIFCDRLYTESNGSYAHAGKSEFDIKREFLSDDEHRELFGWLDDYIFQLKPDKYERFIISAITDDFIAALYPHDELRQIYDSVISLGINTMHDFVFRELKSKYMTEEERQAEKDAEKARETEQKRVAREAIIQKLKDELETDFDGTFKSIHKFMDKHKYTFNNEDEALEIAAERFEQVITEKGHMLDYKDIGYFLTIGAKLCRKGVITFECYKSHVSKLQETKETEADIDVTHV